MLRRFVTPADLNNGLCCEGLFRVTMWHTFSSKSTYRSILTVVQSQYLYYIYNVHNKM